MRNLMLWAFLVLGLIGLATGAATLVRAAQTCPEEEESLPNTECPDSECPADGSLKAPSYFSIGFDSAVFDATGRHEGWIMSFDVTNFSVAGGLCLEKYENGLKSRPLTDVDDVALGAATRELARRLVLGQVRAVPGREVRRVQFGYNDEESTTSFQGMFTYSEVDDLPKEIRGFANNVKLRGCRLSPLPEGRTPLEIEPLPSMAYLRVCKRLDNGGRSEWVLLLDVTIYDGSKDDRFREPGKAKSLAFLTSADGKVIKMAVKEVARRIVEDELEGMRADERGDAVVQVGYSHLNALVVSAQFHYSSEENLAKGLREILDTVKQDASGNGNSHQTSPETF